MKFSLKSQININDKLKNIFNFNFNVLGIIIKMLSLNY